MLAPGVVFSQAACVSVAICTTGKQPCRDTAPVCRRKRSGRWFPRGRRGLAGAGHQCGCFGRGWGRSGPIKIRPHRRDDPIHWGYERALLVCLVLVRGRANRVVVRHGGPGAWRSASAIVDSQPRSKARNQDFARLHGPPWFLRQYRVWVPVYLIVRCWSPRVWPPQPPGPLSRMAPSPRTQTI